MSWTYYTVQDLPGHCTPENDFLYHLSSAFHVCIPTPLAFISNLLGALSIVSWLFAQLPQIYKNWSIQSTSGLSIYFLVEWCLGDVSNLLGCLFTHQATWQVAIGAYYVFVDLCLVGQWIWYEKLRHGQSVFRVWKKEGGSGSGGDGRDTGEQVGPIDAVVIEGMPRFENARNVAQKPDQNRSQRSEGHSTRSKQDTRPRPIFRMPTFEEASRDEEEKTSTTPGGTIVHRPGVPSFPMPSPSPRTVLLIACLVAIVQASPVDRASPHHHAHHTSTPSGPTALEQAGTVLSWISTALYLGSRLPQLFKNWQRQSTAGLSPHLFIAAFCGNLCYSSALLTNPSAWSDFAPYGGGGWAGPEGSDRAQWVLAALPFFLGAAGVLGLDASVGVQFLMYGEARQKLVVVEDAGSERSGGPRWQWRKVEGWMRGWIPSIGEASKGSEREALIDRGADGERREGYGAL